ncbi:ribonuclease Y, partial [Candidatus Kaiserbacteria bacterium CG_4_9_14_0_2_um_filter_41_32]
MTLITLLATIVAMLGLGIAAGYYLRYLHALSKKSSIEITNKQRLLEAEARAIKIQEKAEEKAAAIELEAKTERKALEEKLNQKEARLEKREELLDGRQIDADSQKEALQNKIEEVKSIKARLDERKNELDAKLETIAGITAEEAFEKIVTKIEIERTEDLNARLQKIELFNNEQIEAKATNILLSAIHRIGNVMPTSVMTSHLEIPSDDLKGKIIGKEGRNVRAFERATGVDVLIDETPGYIVLSSFDPIRREIARVAMEALLKDGRIQPAKIEEAVDLARKEVASI